MSDILDEGLLRKQRRKDFLCRRFRNITLVFTGVMLLLYFIFRIQHWPGADTMLVAGLFSILLQTIGCYFSKDERTTYDTVRLVLMLAFTTYLLYDQGFI